MTLAPVFIDGEPFEALDAAGVWAALLPDIDGQRAATRAVWEDLEAIIRGTEEHDDLDERCEAFLNDPPFEQRFFFLILFRSVLRTLGVPANHLELYSRLNYAIQGTITSADNILDGQGKSLLPAEFSEGARLNSVVHLMLFERLATRSLATATKTWLDGTLSNAIHDAILREMIEIGRLEGSEEAGGVAALAPAEMLPKVHAVRGGALFKLAFVAPLAVEEPSARPSLLRARDAIGRIGTAFQLVDDIVDFESDLHVGSYNMVRAFVDTEGTEGERSAVAALLAGDGAGHGGEADDVFAPSMRRVMELAKTEARSGFRALAELGFAFPEELSDQFVEGIGGEAGSVRMRTLAG